MTWNEGSVVRNVASPGSFFRVRAKLREADDAAAYASVDGDAGTGPSSVSVPCVLASRLGSFCVTKVLNPPAHGEIRNVLSEYGNDRIGSDQHVELTSVVEAVKQGPDALSS